MCEVSVLSRHLGVNIEYGKNCHSELERFYDVGWKIRQTTFSGLSFTRRDLCQRNGCTPTTNHDWWDVQTKRPTVTFT